MPGKILYITLTLTLSLPLELVAQQTYSCMNTPEHRQFDFWAGEWRVTDEKGEQHFGDNSIVIGDRGCTLKESWKSALGGSGSSINFYDPSDKKWHQIWADSGNSIIRIAGNPMDAGMMLEGEIYYLQEGRRADFRGYWAPLMDGRVRQHFEEKDSNGEWQTWFDGYYHRSDASAYSEETTN